MKNPDSLTGLINEYTESPIIEAPTIDTVVAPATQWFGLTNAELDEHQALREKGPLWRGDGIDHRTEAEKERYLKLETRMVYSYRPEGKIVAGVCNSDYFVNKDEDTNLELEDARTILKTHPDFQIWTVVDGEDGSMWLERGFHTVNRIYYMVGDPSKLPSRKEALARA